MPTVKNGQVLISTYLFSVDPTMRNAMAGPSEVASTLQKGVPYYDMMNWQLGQPPTGSLIGVVVESKSPSLQKGDLVQLRNEWKLFLAVGAAAAQKLDTSITPENHLGMLGGTGLAAYLPIKHFAQPKPGEVAFVSGAAGATGLAAVQILKLMGCEVIGSAGDSSKVKMLERLGVRAFNYKTEKPLTGLQRLAPKGVDIYFDNVGGEMLEAALEVMKDLGRVLACGTISQYDTRPEQKYGVKNLFHIVAKRIRFQGYITMPGAQFTPEDFVEASSTLTSWLKEGQIVDEHTVMDGFENLPHAMFGLFSGKNTGKMMVRVPEARPRAGAPAKPKL